MSVSPCKFVAGAPSLPPLYHILRRIGGGSWVGRAFEDIQPATDKVECKSLLLLNKKTGLTIQFESYGKGYENLIVSARFRRLQARPPMGDCGNPPNMLRYDILHPSGNPRIPYLRTTAQKKNSKPEIPVTDSIARRISEFGV
jgi:hypothetical protein